MAKTVNNVKINTTFATAASREQLTSGENLCTSLGKINKYLVDLDTGAFSFPANGGNADTVDGKHASDLAYLTDVIGGLKLGYASANAGTIMTYDDREVVKTTNDLAYFGWTINADGWFVPIVVSQHPSGTKYTMFGNNYGYGISQDSEYASFAYKGRTYYACWSNGGAYLNPTVVGGLHLTLTNNDYISACKTLINACEAIDSDTLAGMHAWNHGVLNSSGYFDGNAYFLCKENATGDGRYALLASDGKEIATHHAYVSGSVVSPGSKVRIWEDGEGGNLRLTSPDGNHYVEMDCFNNEIFRMYFVVAGGDVIQALTYNFTTKKLLINGNADTVDDKHASDFYQIASGLRTGTTPQFDIFSTTLSSDHPCWNKWCHVVGNSTDDSTSDYINNAPEVVNALWYEVFTGGNYNRAFQVAIGCFSWQNKTFIRYQHDGVWSGWKNIADGGNADTVNGLHAWTHGVLNSTGNFDGQSYFFCKDNAFGDNRWAFLASDGRETRCNYAYNSESANSAGGLSATASNICLRNMSSGTAAANTTNCPSGAWYGKHD